MNDSLVIGFVAIALGGALAVLAVSSWLLARAARALTALRQERDRLEAARLRLAEAGAALAAGADGGPERLDRRIEDTDRAVEDMRRQLDRLDRRLRAVGDAAGDLPRLRSVMDRPETRAAFGEALLDELLTDAPDAERDRGDRAP